MDPKILLAKSLTLLYRESQLAENVDSSVDLVRTVIDRITPKAATIGSPDERTGVVQIKQMVLEMCTNPPDHKYDLAIILQQLQLATEDEKYFEAIKSAIETPLDELDLKKSINNIKKSILALFKDQEILEILTNASMSFRYNRDKIKDVSQYISELIAQLEPLQGNIVTNDPGVLDDIDIGNDEALVKVFTEIDNMNSGIGLWKTGWPGLNQMLQGGFRPGETWVLGSGHHGYKTGLSLSLFAQFPMFNVPPPFLKPGRIPLLLRISFEDELVNNLQFLYQFLKYTETRKYVKLKKIDETTSEDERLAYIKELAAYVKRKLQVNGFHVRMMKVDPAKWTYKSLFNKVLELESQGYQVLVLGLDYLSKIPTTGCINTGPSGTDLLDLYQRTRGFCSAKKILHLTPHQLNTEAISSMKGTVPDHLFAKMLHGKSLFEGSKGLRRIYDGCILTNLCKYNNKWFLEMMLDKHRFPTVVEEEFKHMYMEFPDKMPIPYCREEEDNTLRSLKEVATNVAEDFF